MMLGAPPQTACGISASIFPKRKPNPVIWSFSKPSIVSSIRLGLLPTTASLASAGIVTVPGMMAGQIIAGGNPIDAAKYQFMILATIAALTLLADSIIMLMVYKRCFTALDQYQPVNG